MQSTLCESEPDTWAQVAPMLDGEKWTPIFGPRNAEIKLGFQALLD